MNDDLVKQHRQLKQELKQLRESTVTFINSRIAYDHFWSGRQDEWCLSYYNKASKRWVSIVRDTDREVVIRQIDEVITDLQGLKKMLGVEKWD